MRIQHNIAALNSYRQLSGNNNALSKNLEKLSSGYRINRAGDDAAGLAISENGAAWEPSHSEWENRLGNLYRCREDTD